MPDEQEIQRAMADFERNRISMLNVSAQKQQVQAQSKALADSLEALKKTTEKKVYKGIGNILILSDVRDVTAELKEQKEVLDLRAKTMQKQEDALVEKLNKMKSEIEAMQKPQPKKTPEKK